MLGTSDRGRIYDISNEGRETLVLQSDTGQISGIFSSGNKLFAASEITDIISIGPETLVKAYAFRLDAKSIANWEDLVAGERELVIETRSGNTDSPSESWSAWRPVEPSEKRGRVASPSTRFFQWRALLKSGQAVLNEVNVAFLPRNIAPEVTSISILPANVGLLANPPIQIDPNIELSGIDPAIFGIQIQPVQPRRAYQRGARSFQWTT